MASEFLAAMGSAFSDDLVRQAVNDFHGRGGRHALQRPGAVQLHGVVRGTLLEDVQAPRCVGL